MAKLHDSTTYVLDRVKWEVTNEKEIKIYQSKNNISPTMCNVFYLSYLKWKEQIISLILGWKGFIDNTQF